MRMFLFFLGVNCFYYEIYIRVLAFMCSLYLDVRLEAVGLSTVYFRATFAMTTSFPAESKNLPIII